jgi:hypothetical protein
VINIPENIAIRDTPLKGEALKTAEENIRRFFNEELLTLSEADQLYYDFFGMAMRGKVKHDKMENAVNDFLFSGELSFDRWFSTLPAHGQKILYTVVFEKCVTIFALEKALNIKIKIVKERLYAYLSPAYNLNFITLSRERVNDFSYFISIAPLYRAVLLPWFAPPPESLLTNCACDESHGAAAYNNSAGIAEAVPLFCEAVNDILNDKQVTEKSLYKAFSKKTINELYKASGFPPFPFETEKALAPYSPAASDMLAHFLFFTTGFSNFARPKNPAEFLRGALNLFFGLQGQNQHASYVWIPETLEYNMFFSHLVKSAISIYTQTGFSEILYLRTVLRRALLAIAEDGRTFDARALVKRMKYLGYRLCFFPNRELRNFKIRADAIHLETKLERDSWEAFYPNDTLCFDFVEQPLFFGYLYLCASLGILEITQAPPPLICERNGKMFPVSVFDSLKTVKITEFGLWCLGLTAAPPAVEKSKYEAIADNELFLVTVRGKSLERTIFLDRIGEKLGSDRWRINPSTFISGCENKAQIADRVEKFRRLIDPVPAPHWEKLFKTVLTRTGFLDGRLVDALVFQLPFDDPDKREVSAELLADPELRAVAMRAEGGLIIVPHNAEKRFLALLAAHGISHF